MRLNSSVVGPMVVVLAVFGALGFGWYRNRLASDDISPKPEPTKPSTPLVVTATVDASGPDLKSLAAYVAALPTTRPASADRLDTAMGARMARWIAIRTSTSQEQGLGVKVVSRNGDMLPCDLRWIRGRAFVFVPWGYGASQRKISARVVIRGVATTVELPDLPNPKLFPPPPAKSAWPGLSIRRCRLAGPQAPNLDATVFLVEAPHARDEVVECEVTGSSANPSEPYAAVRQIVGGGPFVGERPALLVEKFWYPAQTQKAYFNVRLLKAKPGIDVHTSRFSESDFVVTRETTVVTDLEQPGALASADLPEAFPAVRQGPPIIHLSSTSITPPTN